VRFFVLPLSVVSPHIQKEIDNWPTRRYRVDNFGVVQLNQATKQTTHNDKLIILNIEYPRESCASRGNSFHRAPLRAAIGTAKCSTKFFVASFLRLVTEVSWSTLFWFWSAGQSVIATAATVGFAIVFYLAIWANHGLVWLAL
jgi:hypothetical protein